MGRSAVGILTFAALTVVFSVGSSAPGATLIVGGGEAFATLQAAIDAASPGDMVVVRDGTYAGPGNRDIDFRGKAITVKSENGPQRCVISCGGSAQEPHRGFTFRSGEGPEAVLLGFTITGGTTAKGLQNPETCGGAVRCLSASPTITGNVISSNSAGYAGGGIYVSGGSPRVIANTITANSAFAGGGVMAVNASVLLAGNTIQGNTSPLYGGAGIYLAGEGSPTISGNVIASNTAAVGLGGGIFTRDASANIRGNIIVRNQAYYGAGVCSYTAPTNITSSAIAFNTSSFAGGGICCVGPGSRTLTSTIFWANTAVNGPEIALLNNNASLTMSYCNARVDWQTAYVEDKCALVRGYGIIYGDPLFANADAGDYHLRSRYGRWNPTAGAGAGGWEIDSATSPCINAGDPAAGYANEPQPNGYRINMGPFGNTAQASKGKWNLPGDATCDGKVNSLDLILIRTLLGTNPASGENWRADVNEDGRINLFDLMFVRGKMAVQYAITIMDPYRAANWSTFIHVKANLHTHTLQSDGTLTPTEMIDNYAQHGYGVLAITDHDQVTHPWTAYGRDPAVLGMLDVQGNELSASYHVNSLFCDYTSTSGNVDVLLPGIAAKYGIATFNHPGWYSLSAEYYANYYRKYPQLVGQEIYNQNDRFPLNRPKWDEVLTLLMPDRPVWGFSNDDSHYPQDLFYNYNVLLLESVTMANAKAAIMGGQFYATHVKSPGAVAPTITSILVDEKAGTITINAVNCTLIKWISDGQHVTSGAVINCLTTPGVGKYVRAELSGTNGTTYTNPFGIRRTSMVMGSW